MVRAYSLYFDRPRSDWERRTKRFAAVAILAVHLLGMGWLLLTRPPLPAAVPSLIMVELNTLANVAKAIDRTRHSKRDAAKAAPEPTRSIASRESGVEAHAAGAAQRPVAEGRMRPTDDVGLGSTGASALAAAVAAGNSGVGTADGRGRGAIGHFTPPRVLHRWNPPYPLDAWANHVEGDVDVAITVAADGSLLEAHVDRSSGNASLDAAAVAAVRRYTFKPGLKNGQPIESQAIVAIGWQILPGIRVDTIFTLPGDTLGRDVEQRIKALEFLQR